MGLVAFSLMLVIVAFESRDQKATVFTTATFDNATLNIVALVEIVLAVLIARGGALTSLLDSQALTDTQWLIGAAPAVVLLLLWGGRQGIARSRSGEAKQAPAAAWSGAPRNRRAANSAWLLLVARRTRTNRTPCG